MPAPPAADGDDGDVCRTGVCSSDRGYSVWAAECAR